MKRIFLTGGAGFIGRSLVRLLEAEGYAVTVLDFAEPEQPEPANGTRWITGDTRDRDLVMRLMRGHDAVIHLAAPSSFLMHEEDDIRACSFTLVGFKTVMETARHLGIKNVIWASTSAVYERNPVPYHEDMPLNPPDSKAGCKLFCEQEARRYSERYGFRCIGMRPFSVYGTGEHTKLGYANVTSLFTWAMMAGHRPVIWGDGSQTRDFIFVDDAARAFLLALQSDAPTQELNVGTGVETSFNDVVKIIAEELGTQVSPIYVDVPIAIYAHRLLADMERVKKVLGFQPPVSLREGIKRIIAATAALPAEVRSRLGLENQQHYYKTLERGANGATGTAPTISLGA
jgi:nucleoside-diphosphate-sugar epimerase